MGIGFIEYWFIVVVRVDCGLVFVVVFLVMGVFVLRLRVLVEFIVFYSDLVMVGVYGFWMFFDVVYLWCNFNIWFVFIDYFIVVVRWSVLDVFVGIYLFVINFWLYVLNVVGWSLWGVSGVCFVFGNVCKFWWVGIRCWSVLWEDFCGVNYYFVVVEFLSDESCGNFEGVYFFFLLFLCVVYW